MRREEITGERRTGFSLPERGCRELRRLFYNMHMYIYDVCIISPRSPERMSKVSVDSIKMGTIPTAGERGGGESAKHIW